MIDKGNTTLTALVLTIGLLATAGAAAAHQGATSELLLPYFEVDLGGTGPTTFFSVVNADDEAVELEVRVFSNWGIEILESVMELEGGAVKSVSLSDWLVSGELPDRQLSAAEVEHCQAALSGQMAPDELYYSTEVDLHRIVGYLTVRTRHQRSDVIFGDYFIVDPAQDFAQGEVMIDIAGGADCPTLCKRHGLRFLAGGGFDDGTEIVIWTGNGSQPSSSPYFPDSALAPADVEAHEQSGQVIDRIRFGFTPLQVLKVSDLSLGARFGWLDLVTEKASFVTVRYSAERRFSVGLQTSCLPSLTPSSVVSDDSARIRIEMSTNGLDADHAPGPEVHAGAAITWTYTVTNVGDVELFDVAVTDDSTGFVCEKGSLAAGESTTCDTHGTAWEGQYSSVGTVVARTMGGQEVSDSDPSHCYGKPENPGIDIEQAINGEDGDERPGVLLTVGDAVTWTYVVTNTGDVDLSGVTVTDDQEGLICQRASLTAGQSMSCERRGVAKVGPHAGVATVNGTSPNGQTVTDSDLSHYNARPDEPQPENPEIDLEKSTNGSDADEAPGVRLQAGDAIEWTFTMTNVGDVDLVEVMVTDDKEGLICQLESLAVGQTTICRAQGTAAEGPYRNLGSVTAASMQGTEVSDSDLSHYEGFAAE